MAHKRKDLLWKSAIDEFVVELLRFFYPDADELFDLSQPIVFLDPELAQLFPGRENMEDSSTVDRLIRVVRKDGGQACIYLLLEVHDYYDTKIDYAERLFRCFIRLYDKYGQCVTALVLYTGSNSSFFSSGIDFSLLGTRLSFRYELYRVLDQGEEELKRSDNAFAVFMRVVLLAMRRGRIGDGILLDMHVELAREILKWELPRDKLRELLQFVSLYINFGNLETNRKLEYRINEILVKTKRMTISEAAEIIRTEEAIEENKTAFVKKLLIKTNHTIPEIADLADVTIDFVLEIKKALP